MKNPLRGLRFSLLDFHSARANTGLKIAMLGIALIPLIYGALYLMAFYDPYGSLDTLPVAVVNEDVPTHTSSGKLVDAGDELVDKLRESKSLDYHFLDSADEAQAGLEKGTYYNIIVIPEDFSKNIASADTDAPHQAKLVMVANEANNYLSSILGASVMRVVTAQTNYAIGDDYYVQIFDSIDETGESLKVASDGATELADGLVDAHDGSQKITENLATARDGSRKLQDGLASAEEGSSKITTNLGTAKDGARSLDEGLGTAEDGAKTIAKNLATARDGSNSLDKGLASAEDGAKTIAGGLGTARDGAGALDEGLDTAEKGAGALATNLATADAGAATLAKGISDAATGSSTLSEGVSSAKTGADALASGLGDLQKGLADGVKGSQALSDGATKLKDEGTTKLAAGAASLKSALDAKQDGFKQIGGGVDTLVDSVLSLAPSLGKLSAAISDTGATAYFGSRPSLRAQLNALEAGKAQAMEQANALINVANDAASRAGSVKAQAESLAGSVAPAMQSVGSSLDEAGTYLGTESGVGADLATIGGAAQAAGGALGGAATDLGAVKSGLEQAGAALAGDPEPDGSYTLKAEQYQALVAGISSAGSSLSSASDQLTQVQSNLGAVGNGLESASNNLASAGSSIKTAGTELGDAAGSLSSMQDMFADGSDAQVMLSELDTISGSLPAVGSGMDALLAAADALTGDAEQMIGQSQDMLAPMAGSMQQLPALKGGVDELVGSLTTTAQGTIYGGVCQIAAGASELDKNMETLVAGASKLADGTKLLSAGATSAKTGSDTLAGGLAQLDKGASALATGIGTAKTGADSLADGTHQLAGGAGKLETGIKSAHEGAGSLATGLDKLATGSDKLATGVGTAHTGASALAAGLGQLTTGSNTLAGGMTDAHAGATALANGLGQLTDGSATLTKGIDTARNGSATLTDGLGQLTDGSATLTSGLVDAKDGAGKLSDGLSEGVEKVADATKDSDAKAQMMSEPVAFEQERYTSVPNYGSGFAPYFIALGLWVGSLVMTFLLRPLNDRLVISGVNPLVAAFSGLVPWLIVGLVQAVLLAATIQFACKIDVAHPVAYYLLTILASWVFCSIIQMISASLGFPGKFVAVVLLMLQLTTAAGTFPIETEFPIFQAMSPYLPMTYVVHGLRQAMAGVDLSLVGGDVAALVCFAAVAFGITSLVAWRKRLVTMFDLHPLVNLG